MMTESWGEEAMQGNLLEQLESMTRELQQKFNAIIEPYRNDLWRYCMALTKSPWDAEDLMQETLVKAYAILPQLHQPLQPKAYLFRIASNAWVDQCRRRKPDLLAEDDDLQADSSAMHAEEVIAAMEVLIDRLSPRQAVIVLLVDVFDFTVREAAELMSTTEATAKSSLQRARNKLRKIEGPFSTVLAKGHSPNANNRLLNLFIEAYNRRDASALVELMDIHISEEDSPVFRVYGRDQMEKSCLADWVRGARPLQATIRSWWDRTAIFVTCRDSEDIELLNSIIELQVEDGKIVKWRDYYFSKEFMAQASVELGLGIDVSKELYGN
jgi:RNA polymerase sigma factor (sigma-70 family)